MPEGNCTLGEVETIKWRLICDSGFGNKLTAHSTSFYIS